jgi:ion channel-forming bestrophin family protein
MVKYNPKEWFSLIFKFHKSDTFRILFPVIIAVAVYTFIIAYIELELWKIGDKNVSALHSLLGFVLSLLLVFRTNTAYERWWEGRKQWGELVNNSRNLMLKIRAFVPDEHNIYRESVAILISNFVFNLKEHLRNNSSLNNLDENGKVGVLELKEKTHLPNAIALQLYKLVNEMYIKKVITGDQLILLNLELKSFTDIAGGCERIKSTPIPYSYSIFIKKFIFVYIITLPFAFVSVFGYMTIPVVGFVFYVLASLELIAEEI